MPYVASKSSIPNRILAALTPSDLGRLQDDLELVTLALGQILFEPGDKPAYVYFPATCIVSLVFTTHKGASAELAITGNDGMVGIPLVLGGETTTHRAVIQSAGTAYRLKTEVMRWELDQGGEFQHLALRYTQALMTQMAQSVVCNRHHSVDQQLCRWLLLSLDRLPGNHLRMTQELIGHMLGVRREAVTEAAGKLQAAGLIQYSRGNITVIDRDGLEARVCECYAAVKSEYDRLFQMPPAVRPKGRARPNPETLRKRAEARLLQASPESAMTPWDSAQLLHELQVHQIELEMHNEELRHAYDEADALIERYADIYDFAPVGYFTLDREGVIIDMNLAGSILLGIKSSHKGRHRFASRLLASELPGFESYFATVFAARDKTTGEFRLAANEHRPESVVKVEAVPDESGEECRMVVFDITPAKNAERTLQAREQYLRAVIDNLPFMAWLKDDEGRFLAVNRHLSEHLGYASADLLIGKNDFDISPPEIAAAYRADDLATLEAGARKTLLELDGADGEHRWLEVYKSPVSLAGQPIGTVGLARDVTQEHGIQQALANSERQFRQSIERMPLSIAILQDGLLRYLNPKGMALLGCRPEASLDIPFLPFVHESDRQWASDAHRAYTLGEAIPDGVELKLQSHAGQTIDCLMHISGTEWEGRSAMLAIFEDISEKNRLDAELRRLASTDSITGLATQAHFIDHMEQAHAGLKRDKAREATVLLVAIDNFPRIVDGLGQRAADAILRLFAGLLQEAMRHVDFAGRVGRQSFAILLPEAGIEAARAFDARLRQKAGETSITSGGKEARLTLSIGIAAMAATDASPDLAYRQAETALARAGEAGGGRTIVAGAAETLPPSERSGNK